MATRLSRSITAAWLVVAVELALTMLVHRDRVASVWELQFGVAYLAPVVLALSALVGALGGVLLTLAERGHQRPVRLALALLAAGGAAAVAWGVGGGRHLAGTWLRGGFAVGVAAVAGAIAYLALPRLSRALERQPDRVALAAALAIAALELLNRFVLVRLYPAFHLALGLLALLLAPALLLPLAPPRRRLVGPMVVGGVLAVALGTAAPASTRLASFDNFRLLLLEQAPLAGRAVEVAARLAPPAPLEQSCEGPDCVELAEAGERSIDLRDRDLLLITIDALRADHVGAYGYRRPTTPNIDALGAEGTLFDHAYAPTPHTSYSVTSLMTGKYMRPLLLQGAGHDSDTWARLLRTYGYRTAAFYPPAVFFIDSRRFESFSSSYLGFEYRKVEFSEGDARVAQVRRYLNQQPADRRLFVWVHLFAPHEPYEKHPGHAFGDRDIDRYDSEIAFADATVGKLVELFRGKRENAAVIVTSDHGEEFGEHGGRYHGTTVYEEQVRVPLVLSAPGAIPVDRIEEPVQTIDLLPTVLAALEIPRPPRLRGRDLGPLVMGQRPSGEGLALVETDEQALLVAGPHRLVCQRRLGACALYDLTRDPQQKHDSSRQAPGKYQAMRERLRQLSASHGRYEVRGLRAEGKGWPAPILRGVSGDGDAAEEIAALLDDADVAIRRKAAELLFELRREETAPALRLALSRDEDPTVRRWAALALTRLGQGAPLVYELVRDDELGWRRLAALALAESGDARGDAILVAWWKDAAARDYARSRQLLDAFAAIRSEDAVWPLVKTLDDVRLRPHIAKTLAAIGEDVARVPLARALAQERYQGARLAIAEALVKLGAEGELAQPLVRFLGVPDPLPGGLGFALQAGILPQVGGPGPKALAKLKKDSELGVALTVVVPRGGNRQGVRVLVRARTRSAPGEVRVGTRLNVLEYNRKGEPIKVRNLPRINPNRMVAVTVPASAGRPVEVYAQVPPELGLAAGKGAHLVVHADRQVEIEALAFVPLADELPPPAPEPWSDEDEVEGGVRPASAP